MSRHASMVTMAYLIWKCWVFIPTKTPRTKWLKQNEWKLFLHKVYPITETQYKNVKFRIWGKCTLLWMADQMKMCKEWSSEDCLNDRFPFQSVVLNHHPRVRVPNLSSRHDYVKVQEWLCTPGNFSSFLNFPLSTTASLAENKQRVFLPKSFPTQCT